MVAQAAVGRFIDNNDLLWASALTYTTALSIVPLLVLVFSVLKGLGYTDQLSPVITQYVGSPEIAAQLLGFVHNMKVARFRLGRRRDTHHHRHQLVGHYRKCPQS